MSIILAQPLEILRPQLALAAGALAVLAAGASRRFSQAFVNSLALAAVAAALGSLVLSPSWGTASPPLFASDLLGWGVQSVFLAAAMALLYVMEPADEVPPALVLGSLIGMGVLAVSGNLLMLFIGLEMMSLPAYLLTARSRSRGALEAAVKYFFAGSTAGALYLMGMALHFSAGGGLELTRAPGTIGSAGLALMGAAALFKLGAVPLHFWLPDVYEASDPELAGFFSTALKSAAVLLLVRLAGMAPQGAFASALPWAAALTILFGAVTALRQGSMQRLLAYSSISHAGYMILAVSAWARQDGSRTSTVTVFFYLLSYLFMSGGAFLWLKTSGLGSREQLRGLARARPAESAILAVLLLALAGIPPTAGFLAKFLVFWEAFKAGLYVPLVLAGAGALLSLGYYLGIIRDMYFEDPVGESTAEVPAVRGRGLTACCAAVSVLLGLVLAGVQP